jgi:hypothetical protein
MMRSSLTADKKKMKIPTANYGLVPTTSSSSVVVVVLLALVSWLPVSGKTTTFATATTAKSIVPPPTLVMGLPRSGSLAIHEFFECNQIQSSIHYCCGNVGDSDGGDSIGTTAFPCGEGTTTCGSCVFHNLNASRPAFEKCGTPGTAVYSQFDVETGDPFSWFLPQHFALPLLYKAADRDDTTVWILNHRSDSRTWAISVLHWFSVSTRLFHAFNLTYWSDIADESAIPIALTQSVTYDQLVEQLQQSVQRATSSAEHERRIALLADVYDLHLQKVTDFAKRHSDRIQLVDVNVDDDIAATARVLVEAFGGKESCWKFDPKTLDEDWKDFSLKV